MTCPQPAGTHAAVCNGGPSRAARSDRGGDRPAALAEANGRKPLTPAVRAHDHRVAVLEEAAALAGCERDRPTASGRDLEQAAERAVVGAGDRAGAENVARPQVAAATGVMGDELRDRPVEIARVAGRQPMCGEPFVAQSR